MSVIVATLKAHKYQVDSTSLPKSLDNCPLCLLDLLMYQTHTGVTYMWWRISTHLNFKAGERSLVIMQYL